MKLYRYQNFIKESNSDIHSICSKYDIRNYVINDDLTIDVNGDVCLDNKGLTELPLKFRNVSGHFFCENNQLISLEGAPRKVSGHFYCFDNQLTSLEGSPKEVGSHFYCQHNQLTNLEGISKYISGLINCRYNKLRDVKGVPDGWRGEFHIEGNPVKEIFKLFPQKRWEWDEVIEHLNEYNVIRDGKVVIMQALERVFWELDLEVPEIEEIEGYEIQF